MSKQKYVLGLKYEKVWIFQKDAFSREGIKRLILWHCGKQNTTRQQQIVHFFFRKLFQSIRLYIKVILDGWPATLCLVNSGNVSVLMRSICFQQSLTGQQKPQAVQQQQPPQCNQLVDCGSYIAAIATMPFGLPQSTRWNLVHLVHCGSSWIAAVPQ